MLKTREQWKETASKHWQYISGVIRFHGTDRNPVRRRMLRNCESFYMRGMIDGYFDEEEATHWKDIEANYDGIITEYKKLGDEKIRHDEVTFFHYRTAYKHGKKHRLQDL